MYLFTNKKGNKVFSLTEFIASPWMTQGQKALAYRKRLQKELGEPVVAWSLMGGDNEQIEKEAVNAYRKYVTN